MTVSRVYRRLISTLAVVVALCCAASTRAAEPGIRPEQLLTEAYYIQSAITPIEQEIHKLTAKPTDQDVQSAIDGFEAAWDKANEIWQQNGIKLPIEAARADVRSKGLVDKARSSLDSGDAAAARTALQEAHKTLLDVAWKALAERFVQVGEKAGEPYSFSGWIELAGVRLKQSDPMAAKEALWKAYGSTRALADADMEQVLRAFENLSEHVGQGLMARQEFAAAKEHYTKLLAAPEPKKPVTIHTHLGMACLELDDWACATEHLTAAATQDREATSKLLMGTAQGMISRATADTASYGRAYQLVELWRTIAPDDPSMMRLVASAVSRDQAKLMTWFQEATDCGTKAHLVHALQQGSATEPHLDLAQAALACDPANETAKAAVATAHYRMAVDAWNALANDPPKGLGAAAPRLDKIRELLAKAEGAEGTAQLLDKVNNYKGALQANQREVEERREAVRRQQCAGLLDRARWARNEPRVALADLSEVVGQTSGDSCASHFDGPASQELADIKVALQDRLQKECDAEYYRLPDIPTDPSTLSQDQIDVVRSEVQTYRDACESFVSGSFRAEKLVSILKKLEAAEASR